MVGKISGRLEGRTSVFYVIIIFKLQLIPPLLVRCFSWYQKAQLLIPKSGRPYHQLALLAVYTVGGVPHNQLRMYNVFFYRCILIYLIFRMGQFSVDEKRIFSLESCYQFTLLSPLLALLPTQWNLQLLSIFSTVDLSVDFFAQMLIMKRTKSKCHALVPFTKISLLSLCQIQVSRITYYLITFYSSNSGDCIAP